MWGIETASDKKEQPSATTRFGSGDLVEAAHYVPQGRGHV